MMINRNNNNQGHDLVGKKIEGTAWTVNKVVESALDGRAQVEATCECGTVRVVRVTPLLHGKSRSCGCKGSQWKGKPIMRFTPPPPWRSISELCRAAQVTTRSFYRAVERGEDPSEFLQKLARVAKKATKK